MTPSDHVEATIAGWLGSAAPVRAPRETLDAVLDRTRAMRPLPAWRARVVVPQMRHGTIVVVGSQTARRAVAAGAVLLVALAAALVVAGAALLRDWLAETERFVYVGNPGSLPAEFCIEGRDCRNGLAGWPGGRFLVSQRPDGSELEVVVEAPWPSTIVDFRLSPDGSRVAYDRTAIGYPTTCRQLVIVDRATGAELFVADFWPEWSAQPFEWWPTNEQVAFVTGGRCSPGGDGLFVYDLESGSLERVLDFAAMAPRRGPTSNEPRLVLLAWDPDGHRVLVASGASNRSMIVTVAGSSSSSVTLDCGCEPWGAAWSPDGSRLAVETRGALLVGDGALLAGDGDGGDFHQIAESGAQASWSPDGAWLAFLTVPVGEGPRSQDRDLLVASADGGDVRWLATIDDRPHGLSTPPRWSPDGEWIYWSDPDAMRAIRPDGTDLRTLALPTSIDLQWLISKEP